MSGGLLTLPLPISKEHSHLICPVCRQLFNNPKNLPCHHSYCEECLEKMQVQSKIICTECRNETTVPAGGVKDLLSNYFMDHLVKKLIFDHKLEHETELRCEECDEDDAVVVFCTGCKLFLCHFCKESHKYSKSHCSHNLISLTELRSNKDLIQSKSKFPTCQEHDLELEYYCETCEKLVCVQCTGEHEDHKYDMVKKVASRYQNMLNKITASIEVMIEDLSEFHNTVEDMRRAIRQQGNIVSEEIDLYYNKVFQKLLKQKEIVKQQVRETVLQKEKALTRQLEEVIYAQEGTVKVKTIRDSLQVSSDQEVLSAKNEFCLLEKLKENLDKIGWEPIESANIKATPINDPVPQFVKHYATIDSLSFEVRCFKSSVQRGQTAILELIAKDSKGNYYPRGGCEVTIQFQSSMEETITAQVIDYNDGTYMICCAAQQVGEIELSVFVNGHKIKDSPFKIVVQEYPIKPNKIITSDDDSFGQLRGIACGNNGTWAVADWSKNCVYVFDNRDDLIYILGSQGNKNGQFKYPCDVAFDDNNELYVTDSCNHRVQKFDPRGNYLLHFGGKGADEGQLNCPVGITAHQDKVYVADRGNHRISVFKKDGKFHSIIGQQQLSQHFDMTININNEILIADWKHHCLRIFTLDGHCNNNMSLSKLGIGSLELKYPCSITTDSSGFILIANTSNHCISIFDKFGNFIHYFESDDPFKFPHGIIVGPNDNIYVTDTGSRRVQIFPGYNS